MFGMVMRNPKYVKPFLEAILKIKIRKVVYPESQKAIDLSANAKGVRLDVYVEDDQNTVFNLEMQTTHKKDLPKRMRYYQGMIDLNILNKGESYCNLKKAMLYLSVHLIHLAKDDTFIHFAIPAKKILH